MKLKYQLSQRGWKAARNRQAPEGWWGVRGGRRERAGGVYILQKVDPLAAAVNNQLLSEPQELAVLLHDEGSVVASHDLCAKERERERTTEREREGEKKKRDEATGEERLSSS